MPPYTVQWRDDTATADALQIPQKNIAVDFGDSESGIANKIFIENTGNTLIAVPLEQLSHIYGGYGAYVAQITITDKNGNTTTSNAQFAPNKEPRLIKAPVLTPLTGDQPLLVTGHAYVAGDPEPKVEWDYVLRGGNPDYYAGQKIGTYAELSLLAGGIYTITCKTLDSGETEIDSKEFEVTINPRTVHEDNPAIMQDFDLIVYDRSTDKEIDRCRQHSTVRYVENYQSGDTFSLRLPVTYPYLNMLYEGDKITIGYLNKARHMIITNRDDGKDSVEISGIDYASYLLQRRPSITATRSTSDNGYDLQRCSAEALIRYFAISNLSGSRAAAKFRVVDANLDRGDVTKYSARYETIEQVISELCKTSGLGWGASLQDESSIIVGFKVTKGTDRTASTGGANAVIFSERLKNAKIGNYYGVLAPNVAIGAGAGNGASREYSFFGETTATDVDRREVFVDAGDAADAEEVQRMAELELENQKQQSVSVRPLPTCQWVFGTDYDVGDIVTIEHPTRGVLELQIISAEKYSDENNKAGIQLTCGHIVKEFREQIIKTKIDNSYARK